MGQITPRTLDVELGPHNILEINRSDALIALFARLGYHTCARTVQTPSNLGITAEGTARSIKRIELIADQENLFQVYLFELTSVTLSHTRALARAFRNLAGNYLLVLTTNDYERLDFVLLDKEVPSSQDGKPMLGTKQVTIRPRILTVERRKPTPVQLRVLRRFTWTEYDPFLQFEKLRSAYDIADWSEEFFNNRALFSDYYLLNRLKDDPVWIEDPKPCYLGLRDLYRDAAARFAGKKKDLLKEELFEPALRVLGFIRKSGQTDASEILADFSLYSTEEGKPPLAFCLIYPWGRALDGKDDQRDTERPDENPGARVVSLLEKGEAPWGIVTNGRLWRLYAQRTHSRATNFYEIDLEEVLAQKGPHAADFSDAFRYFWCLFRREAFETVDVERAGRRQSLALLDRLLLESEDYAKGLGERLKEKVFIEVFPLLAQGFLTYLRPAEGTHRQARSKEAFSAEGTHKQEELDAIFQGTLTLLYRLLFLLYAEARDLLPVREIRDYFEASLAKLKEEIKEAAGTLSDEVEERLKRHYREGRCDLYDALARLFQTVDQGNPALNVPVYNGGLFLSDPADDDESPEAKSARFLKTTKMPDYFLARALDLLSRDIDPKRQDLVFIDYKSLGVRQLGSIYEGLLEFRLRIAERKLAIIKEKGREVYLPFSELDEKGQERAERQGRFIKKGEVYLENDKRERKATGSYYTPDPIVKYIVAHTVGPVLQEKFDAIRPRLREAQQWHQNMIKLARAKGEPVGKYEFGPAVEERWGDLTDALFDVKVVDPAMGSGHFLVEAVDYITDKLLDFLNAFPWNPIRARLARMRDTILKEMEDQGITIDAKRLTDVNLLKRHVLKRCIYGVDLNPMAVELAKVSLWLDCFTLGAPLSFLDHHLRCGNSLIGVTVQEVNQAIETGQLNLLSGTRFEGMKQAVAGMIRIGGLSDVTSAQVQQSRSEYRQAIDAMKPAKRLLDVYASQWFGNAPTSKGRGKNKAEHNRALEFLRDDLSERWAFNPERTALPEEWRAVVSVVLRAAAEKRFFHWELEFPEVFYGPRPGTTQVFERLEGAGFDAVIGNPPYVRQEGLGDDKPFFEVAHAPVYSGVADLYVYFYHRGLSVCRKGGYFGMITSNKFLRAGYGKSLRSFLQNQTVLDLIDFGDLPIFPEATAYPMVFIAKRDPPLDRHAVRAYAVEDMAEAARIDEALQAQGPTLPQSSLREEGWTLDRPEVLRLMAKLREKGVPLGEYVNGRFYRGILTGLNEAFVIDEATRKRLIQEDPKSKEIIKPWLRGRDIKKWRAEWDGLYLIAIASSANRDWPWSGKKNSEAIFSKTYPAIYDHFLQHKEALVRRDDQGTYWWELRSCAYYAEFEKPKIVWGNLATSPKFAMEPKPYYISAPANLIPSDDLYLLGLLNSSICSWLVSYLAAVRGGDFLEFKPMYVGQLPIFLASDDQKIPIVKRVEAVLENPTGPDISRLEQEIDELVFGLYGLTEGETNIVREKE